MSLSSRKEYCFKPHIVTRHPIAIHKVRATSATLQSTRSAALSWLSLSFAADNEDQAWLYARQLLAVPGHEWLALPFIQCFGGLLNSRKSHTSCSLNCADHFWDASESRASGAEGCRANRSSGAQGSQEMGVGGKEGEGKDSNPFPYCSSGLGGTKMRWLRLRCIIAYRLVWFGYGCHRKGHH